MIVTQMNGAACLLNMPEEHLLKDSSMSGSEFEQFCNRFAQSLTREDLYPAARSKAVELLRATFDGGLARVPDGYQYELVVPRLLDGGVVYGMTEAPRLAYRYGPDDVLCEYNKELATKTGGDPGRICLTISRKLRFQDDRTHSYHIGAALRVEIGRKQQMLPTAKWVGGTSRMAGQYLEDSRITRLQNMGVAIGRDENIIRVLEGNFAVDLGNWGRRDAVTFFSLHRTLSVESLETDFIRPANKVCQEIFGVSLPEDVISECAKVARESHSLAPVMAECDLHEYHPMDPECRRFLFDREAEETSEEGPGIGGVYPRQTPLRSSAQRIVAVGGGHFISNYEIINMTGKRNPHVLFLPTASSDQSSRINEVAKKFERDGCTFETLELVHYAPPQEEIERRIRNADIIYVGGGNTHLMMRCWARHGVDKLIAEAGERGAVLSGWSAGAICWFQSGNSDSLGYYGGGSDYLRIKGLDFVDAMLVPHFHPNSPRAPFVKEQMNGSRNVAICLHDAGAIQIEGGKYRILASRPGGHPVAWRACWKDGAYRCDPIPSNSQFEPIANLVNKDIDLPAPEPSHLSKYFHIDDDYIDL
jgi:dipeptidase E